LERLSSGFARTFFFSFCEVGSLGNSAWTNISFSPYSLYGRQWGSRLDLSLTQISHIMFLLLRPGCGFLFFFFSFSESPAKHLSALSVFIFIFLGEKKPV